MDHFPKPPFQRIETPAIVIRYTFVGFVIALAALGFAASWWWSAQSSVSEKPLFVVQFRSLPSHLQEEASQILLQDGINEESREVLQNFDRNFLLVIWGSSQERSICWHNASRQRGVADGGGLVPDYEPDWIYSPAALATLVEPGIYANAKLLAEELLAKERIAVSEHSVAHLAGLLAEFEMLESAVARYAPPVLYWRIDLPQPLAEDMTNREAKEILGVIRLPSERVKKLRREGSLRCFWFADDRGF
jgi:hypothetical protein